MFNSNSLFLTYMMDGVGRVDPVLGDETPDVTLGDNGSKTSERSCNDK